MTEPHQQLTVKCPNCKRSVIWSSENPFRPFCCERCKLIDLGEWAVGEKKIPGEPLPTENELGDDSFFQ
jgi:endogenous inhibitor of DNA gyrase (YacG/DUF329 family)